MRDATHDPRTEQERLGLSDAEYALALSNAPLPTLLAGTQQAAPFDPSKPPSVQPDQAGRAGDFIEPRNNRRPYKADIRGLAEEELGRAADAQINLQARVKIVRESFEMMKDAWKLAREAAGLYRESRNRWRIACLVVAVVGVVGWLV